MEGTTTTDIPKFKLDIINIAETSQIQFGLRVEDYERYRQYLTRRLQRIRRSLKTTLGKKVYQNKITDPKNVVDIRYLIVLLLKTERAWAYAMDLKKQDEEGDEPRKRHHMHTRFLKADIHACLLEKLCQATCDDYTNAEAMAYAATIRTAHMTDRQEWVKARDNNALAKAIYTLLSEIGDSSLKQLYQKRIEDSETIERFCQYNLRDEKDTTSTIDIDKIIKDIKLNIESKNKKGNNELPMSTITWRSKSVKVSEKVREHLVVFDNLQNEFKTLNNDLVKQFPLFDKIITQLVSTERIIKNDVINVERTNQKSKSVKSEIEESNLKIILSFVVYHKMKYLYERNEHLSNIFIRFIEGVRDEKDVTIVRRKKKVSVQDLVRIYGDQIKIYGSMVENRPDISSSAASLTASKDNESMLLWLRSLRLYFIAMHLLSSKKWSETMALLDKVTSNTQQIKKTTKNADILGRAAKVDDLVNKIRSQIHANAFMEQLSTNEDLKKQMNTLSIQTTVKSKDLISGIDNYDSSFMEEQKLVEYPPQLQPIPNKPLFFDLAFNSCEFPSLEARKKSSSKGLFGFWKS